MVSAFANANRIICRIPHERTGNMICINFFNYVVVVVALLSLLMISPFSTRSFSPACTRTIPQIIHLQINKNYVLINSHHFVGDETYTNATQPDGRSGQHSLPHCTGFNLDIRNVFPFHFIRSQFLSLSLLFVFSSGNSRDHDANSYRLLYFVCIWVCKQHITYSSRNTNNRSNNIFRFSGWCGVPSQQLGYKLPIPSKIFSFLNSWAMESERTWRRTERGLRRKRART